MILRILPLLPLVPAICWVYPTIFLASWPLLIALRSYTVYPVACGLSFTNHFLAPRARIRWRMFVHQYMKVMCAWARQPRDHKTCKPQDAKSGFTLL